MAAAASAGIDRAPSGRRLGTRSFRRAADYLAKSAVLALVYVIFARLGLRIHAIHEFATLVWAPTGISLVALLVLGDKYWPGIVVGAWIANTWTGAPYAVALGIAAGNTLEALIGAHALRRLPGFRRDLERLSDILGLIVLAAVLSTAISATIGVASLWLSGIVATGQLAVTWRSWWLGDAIGDLIVAPALLTLPRTLRLPPRLSRRAEAVALALVTVLAGFVVFHWTRNATASLLSPVLIWAAVRFEQRGAARTTLLISVIAIWGTAAGRGPFARTPVEEGLFQLQSFMALTAATFLVLGAVTSEARRSEKERRLAEESIRDSEVRYRTLAEAVDQLMWIADAEGRLKYVNRKWEDSLDETPLDRAPLWEELVHPEEREALLELRREATASAQAYHVETRMRRRNGAYGWMQARLVPVQNAQGQVISWFGAAANIHDLKSAQEDLRHAKEQAEAANRAKDQFLATLSHELRTPLTPVLALSSTLEREQDLSPEVRRRIEIIRRNAELEARLIDDLLDLTSISKGKLQVAPEPLDLGEAIDHVLEICREEAAAKGLLLRWEGDRPKNRVHADPAKMRQVFWNLVKNAIKFTPFGGRVLLRGSEAAPGRVAVEISDTGVGMAPSDLARIFRPFEQAGATMGGLGLGLSISSALVEAHGGTLNVASEGPGRGSVFRVELPTLPDVAPPTEPRQRSTRNSAEIGRSRRVLLVEDHRDTSDAVRFLLGELSCEVVAVGSTAEALSAAATQSFDLVLSDLGLPDGTGLDLMRRLRDRHGLAGIAVTGYGMEEDIRRGREAGFVGHLVKPITFQRMAEAIERFFAEQAEENAT